MREPKKSDSPSGYDRDVYRDRTKRHAHREWPTGALGDAMHAVSVRWTALLAEQARAGQPSPILWDRERLAARIYTLAHAVSFEDAEQRAEMFCEIAALALAGVAAADAAAMLDVSAGQDAA